MGGSCNRLCLSSDHELKQSIVGQCKASEEVFLDGPRKQSLRSPQLEALTRSSRCIQRKWRSYRFRSIIRLASKQIVHSLHLTREDAVETLSSQPLALAREKKTHRYSSGGVYDGQWLGGFRDGWGVMTWPDGAVYRGFWSFGFPRNEGKFTYSDFDVYEGLWIYWNTRGNALIYNLDDCRDGYEWLWLKETSLRQSEYLLD